MRNRLTHFFETLIFPKNCEGCLQNWVVSDVGVCADCQSKIERITSPLCRACGHPINQGVSLCAGCAQTAQSSIHFDEAYACSYYHDITKKILWAYKYHNQKYLKIFFSKLLEDFINQNLTHQHFDGIVAIPMERSKERLRGFNQSVLLSNLISKKLGLADLSQQIARSKSLSAQSHLGRKERFENVKNCFKIKSQTIFRDKKLLLIDDILTTGQTASECARTLKIAGARSVTVLTCARTRASL